MAKTSVNNKYIRDSIENVKTNQITISEDKLRIKLERQLKRLKKASGVLSYLGLTITCVSVLVSNDFREAFGITPDMWKTAFFIAAVFFSSMTLISGFHSIFNRVTVDTIVDDIKTADVSVQKSGLLNWIKSIFHSDINNSETEEEKKDEANN